jgi:hypothetical protein
MENKSGLLFDTNRGNFHTFDSSSMFFFKMASSGVLRRAVSSGYRADYEGN